MRTRLRSVKHCAQPHRHAACRPLQVHQTELTEWTELSGVDFPSGVVGRAALVGVAEFDVQAALAHVAAVADESVGALAVGDAAGSQRRNLVDLRVVDL